MKYVAWLWHNMRSIRWNTLLRIVIGVGQAVFGLLMVWLSKRFIDETIRTGSSDDLVRMIGWLVLTVVGAIVLHQVYYYLTQIANVQQMNRLRLRMFSSLFRRQLFTEQEMHSGDVTSRLAKDIEMVCEATTDVLPQLLVTAIQLCGAFLLMRWFDALLAWALLLLTPLTIVLGKLVARQLRRMTLDIRQSESRIQMQVQEGMEHNAVLRSLGSEPWVTQRLGSMQDRLQGDVVRRTRFTVLARLLLGCTFGLGYLLAFVWGGLQLRAGAITFGVMTSFLQLVGMIQQPILQMLNMIPTLIHATASIDRLEELEQAETSTDSAVSLNTGGYASGIQLQEVSFRYAENERWVLRGFTHDFRPGSKTAIMGETGIGKTTLFRLLLGLISPTEGTISFYDDCGKMLQGTGIQNGFVFVPQGNTLMSDSIRYNLLLAKPVATDEELKEVLHIACADFVFDLPEGLDTMLGERGGGLSEGQAQRIAIARGLLRPGGILLLDEISSALDEPTERELYHRLFEAYPQKTILCITHRTAVSALCDAHCSLIDSQLS